MNFRDYFMGLDAEGREAFAKRAETTVQYIKVGFVSSKSGPRKTPQLQLFRRFIEATEGKVSAAEMVDFFGFASLDEMRQHFDAEAAEAAEAADTQATA